MKRGGITAFAMRPRESGAIWSAVAACRAEAGRRRKRQRRHRFCANGRPSSLRKLLSARKRRGASAVAEAMAGQAFVASRRTPYVLRVGESVSLIRGHRILAALHPYHLASIFAVPVTSSSRSQSSPRRWAWAGWPFRDKLIVEG